MQKGLNKKEEKQWPEVKAIIARHDLKLRAISKALGKNDQFLYQPTGQRYLLGLLNVINDFPELFNTETAKEISNV